uniref:Uncharacterized protein n=1 Tax=Ananas comosus var. bracteatus TaxID=296719 RepID=A0A6V7PXX1_ANACO|nr:unnamed protein product [Ananas comosus var. bracteatus]
MKCGTILHVLNDLDKFLSKLESDWRVKTLAESWQQGCFGNFTLDPYLFEPSTTLGAQWRLLETREAALHHFLSLSPGFFSFYVDFADFARFRRRVRSSLFASVAGPTWTCEGVFWRVFRSSEPAGHWLEA